MIIDSFRDIQTLLELPALSEVEGSTGKALLQDRHDRDKHLRADLSVEFKILL